MNGGMLEFTMGHNPNGMVNKFISAPTLNQIPTDFCPIPYFSNESRVFEDKTIVSIVTPTFHTFSNNTIEYKIDGGEWQMYEAPFEIVKSTKVEARTVRDELKSATVETAFVARNTDLSLVLKTDYVHPYTAGGPNALIDGIQGNHEFRTGDWQGFYGQDVIAELSMKTAKEDLEVQVGLLEDIKSWIFYPEMITLEVSYDGIQFEKSAQMKLEKMPQDYRPGNRNTATFQIHSKKPVQKIRITAKNGGNCPAWHLGAGYPSWMFLDEIVVK